MTKRKVLIAQGGGPTAVINESLVGAVLKSRQYDDIEAVYGAFHGVSGIVSEDFINLRALKPTAIQGFTNDNASEFGRLNVLKRPAKSPNSGANGTYDGHTVLRFTHFFSRP